MPVNGELHLHSFADVEAEFVEVRRERADDQMAVMSAIGGLTAEVANLRRADDELRMVVIERTQSAPRLPAMRGELPSGVHDLVEAAVALKGAGEDEHRPITTERVRQLFKAETKRMLLEASASRWDRLVALFPAMGRKALMLAVGAAVVEGLHLLHLLGK